MSFAIEEKKGGGVDSLALAIPKRKGTPGRKKKNRLKAVLRSEGKKKKNANFTALVKYDNEEENRFHVPPKKTAAHLAPREKKGRGRGGKKYASAYVDRKKGRWFAKHGKVEGEKLTRYRREKRSLNRTVKTGGDNMFWSRRGLDGREEKEREKTLSQS